MALELIPCVWELMLPGKISYDRPKIHRCEQRDLSFKFSITLHGSCLNKDGEWEIEPLPSSMDTDFINRCRFNSFSDAVLFLELNYIPKA